MESKKVLVVEDNELNMKLIVALLTLSKIEYVCAEDAESGIELAREHMPDLILMDIQLPGMDGLAATRILKASPDLASIPIIALTGFALDGDLESMMGEGCVGYISKPIDTRIFLDKIQRFLGVST